MTSKTSRRDAKGSETPRLWTKPLRELTPETSLGFEVIEFAELILRVYLYPWQKWLLIHALELNEDGSYRFRRVIVLVARQNGKSLLAAVLAAWWLFVDSDRHPDRIPPVKFRILGTAQNLDTARDVWLTVRSWCDPDVDPEEDVTVRPALQRVVRKAYDVNGKEEIVLKSGIKYLIRAASRKSGRGKSSPRVLMDELREQLDWLAWDSISQTTKAMFSPQLWGFSNAGDARSVVLNHQRSVALPLIEDWDTYVESGLETVEQFANGRDMTLGWFEWSALDDCPLDDIGGILQANPSIGHGEITLESVLADAKGMPEASFRTEVLCQWVTALSIPFMDGEEWSKQSDGPYVDEHGVLADSGSSVAADSEMCLAVDTAGNRRKSYVGVAGWRDDGTAHVELIAQRAGMLWVVDYLKRVREATGCNRVAVQTRGCPASDFVEPLKVAGFEVVEVSGTVLLNTAGRFKDRVRDGLVFHRDQPPLNMAMANGTTKDLSGMPVWDRFNSPVDVAPAVVVTNALYGLETESEKPVLVSAYAAVAGEEVKDWW